MIKYVIIAIMGVVISVGGYIANATIDGLKATITVMQAKHAKVIVKTKLKERSKRLIAAVPVAGVAAAAWFTKVEYEEWKAENPDGDVEQYSSEIKETAMEIVDDYCNEDGSICNHIKSYLKQNI